MEPAFTGFGSPVASPGGFMPVQTPDDTTKTTGLFMDTNSHSPLLFRRTPGITNAITPAPDSGKRFSDWVMSTSPYTGQKTPPTVSMMSVRADENTPPHLQDAAAEGSCGSNQHFQAWLHATSSNNYTPRRSPSAATPPAAPAPTPAGTPMSTSGLAASAVSPAAAEPRSRPLFDLGPYASDSDSDEADDEATTTVGANEIAVAAARMHAALAAAAVNSSSTAAPAGFGAHRSSSFTPPRVPANTPQCCSNQAVAPASLSQQQPQSPQQLTGDSLATPMSHLSMSRAAAGDCMDHSIDASGDCSQQRTAGVRAGVTPGRSRSQAPPASPVDKVIGLMMRSGAGHSHHQQHTPSRLAAPPPSPEQQVIQLMMQQHQAPAQQQDVPAGPGQQPAAGLVQDGIVQQAAAAMGFVAAGDEEQQQDGTNAEAGDELFSGSEYGGSSQSDDEIGVAELQQLCGATAEHGTPIDDIIGMLLTPEFKGTSFTPRAAAGGAAGAEDGVGPRVLFGDDEH